MVQVFGLDTGVVITISILQVSASSSSTPTLTTTCQPSTSSIRFWLPGSQREWSSLLSSSRDQLTWLT